MQSQELGAAQDLDLAVDLGRELQLPRFVDSRSERSCKCWELSEASPSHRALQAWKAGCDCVDTRTKCCEAKSSSRRSTRLSRVWQWHAVAARDSTCWEAFRKGDLVDYWSISHGEWCGVPANPCGVVDSKTHQGVLLHDLCIKAMGKAESMLYASQR